MIVNEKLKQTKLEALKYEKPSQFTHEFQTFEAGRIKDKMTDRTKASVKFLIKRRNNKESAFKAQNVVMPEVSAPGVTVLDQQEQIAQTSLTNETTESIT